MWQIIGHNRAVSLLQRSLERGALSHAYVFTGPSHVGKMTLALNLAQALNCSADERPCGKCSSCQKITAGNHADVQVIGLTRNGESAEAKLISIDQIRNMQHSASLPPFEGNYKIFIIEGAEFLSTEAANCLLKTLEEPADRVIIILLTTNERLLPATVVSRCQRLEMPPVPFTEIEAALNSQYSLNPPKATLLARLSHGCPGWAFTAAQDDSLLEQHAAKIDRLLEIVNADYDERFAYANQLATQFTHNRALVHETLDLWLEFWRDLLLDGIGCTDIITNIDR